MREIRNLNFNWKFSNEYSEEDIVKPYDAYGGEVVQIPHTNKTLDYHYFDENETHVKSLYKKEIEILHNDREKEFFLCFEGVAHYAKVYVNQHFVGEHKGGYTPFELRIDPYLDLNSKVTITVEVDSHERPEIPPFGKVVDYLGYGGIYREVSLKVVNRHHIKDYIVKTKDIWNKHKQLILDGELSENCQNLSLECVISDLEENIIHTFFSPLNGNQFHVTTKIENITLWSLQEPKLYYLTLLLKKGEEILDHQTTRFGFREVEYKAEGFYLNGEKIKIRGLNRHQSYAHVGYAMPKSMQEHDALILKHELGLNLVRTSHYPQSKHFLNKCDEIGLLVFEEIPGWQHVSDLQEWRDITLQHVREMILRDRNHPCIILWGVRINESGDSDELYELTNALARNLDPSRPTGGVRCFKGSHILEDVYTYNDFVHTGKNQALDNVISVTKRRDVPYLVTEHNGHMFPTKRFDHEGKRVEQALRHMRVLDHMYGDKAISGAIGWCMSDYNTHKDFGSGDKICYHGVMDMYRIPKLAAYTYASQQNENPIMEVSSSMDIGEHEGSFLGDIYVFTNLDSVKFYKNDVLIKTYYPNRNKFKHVPNPPILIDDLIGDGLGHLNYTKKEQQIIKEVLHSIMKFGNNVPLISKIKLLPIMLKHKLSIQDISSLYSTYIGNWGEAATTYRFEGYKGDELVKTSTKESVKHPVFQVTIDSNQLIEDETYDVTRVVCCLKDQVENLLPYSMASMQVEIDGPIELIGPNQLSLIGGVRAFYIKTKGKSGIGKIKISTDIYGDRELLVEVIKK